MNASASDWMDAFGIIAIGLVQAVAEWLPLSSKTLDTVVYTQFLGGSPSSAIPLLVYLHLGTMLAAAIYFRQEIALLGVQLASDAAHIFHKGRRIGLANAALPAILQHSNGKAGFLFSALFFTGLVGLPILLIEKFVLPILDASALFSIMGAGLIATGFMLTAQRKDRWRSHASAGWKDGVLTGILQGLSALPGVSRAGATTTALVWRGFDAKSAFHLSFLLSIPTVFFTELVFWLADSSIPAFPVSEGLAAAASSFAFGYLTIDALTKIAQRINVASLAFIFGIMMLAFGLFGLG